MRKIISLFQRDYDGDRLVRSEVVPGAEWVLAGEGIATRKWDGTCCLIRGGKLYKRYEVKAGKTPPPDWEPADDVDSVTGKRVGWRPVGDGPDDQYHREAFAQFANWEDGTYELCGPKVQGNAEGLEKHTLIPHGRHQVDAPRTYDELSDWLVKGHIEGVVWWHEDGRMVKIKGKDFGWRRIGP